MNRDAGRLVSSTTLGVAVKAYIPHPLPPRPALVLDTELQELLGQANRGLGGLDAAGIVLPDISLFLYMYIRKEAVLSSQIEGTQSSLSDLLLFEHSHQPGVPLDDVQEVSNYVEAVYHGLKRLQEDNFPLSLRLLREVHQKLLSKGRGSRQQPGEFRRTQNWIGGVSPKDAVFVPPPPGGELMQCLGDLEAFLHDEPERTPPLIKAALAHVQFETIHPFLDGNGRLGRLLIVFILCQESALSQPLLYLSVYFKRHRSRYYDLLQHVRETGDWEGWLRFFLTGVVETSRAAVETMRHINALFAQDRAHLASLPSGSSALRVHEVLQRRAILGINETAALTQLSAPTVSTVFGKMEGMGMVREVTGRARHRLYVYEGLMRLLQDVGEPEQRHLPPGERES